MGQEIGRLVHQVDAQLGVLDGDVHVHAAGQKALRDQAKVFGDLGVAGGGRVLLLLPPPERMGGGGHQRAVEAADDALDGAAQVRELRACGARVVADLGGDLDLGAHELGTDRAAERGVAVLHHLGTRVDGQIAAGEVDQEVLLLDAEREAGF